MPLLYDLLEVEVLVSYDVGDCCCSSYMCCSVLCSFVVFVHHTLVDSIVDVIVRRTLYACC
jgi:hypothetical protein